MTLPCFYVIESCEPQDVIYRLDYKDAEQTEEYVQMARDYGWECFAKLVGWLYFRKPADEAESAADGELFSDNTSRADMAEHILRTRMLPIMTIFLCCVLPNLTRTINGSSGPLNVFFSVFFGVMFVVYVFLIVYCGIKLNRIRNRYRD